MDEELERFKRAVNLSEFAASLGYQLVRGQRSAASVAMRHPGTDDKIIIRRDRDDHWTYFSVRDDHDNGSIVDFLQRRKSLTLGEVRKELRLWLREDRPRPPAEHFRETLGARTRGPDAIAAAYNNAAVAESKYLLSRGISPATLQSPRFSQSYRVDGRGTVFFPHRDPSTTHVVGYEMKNRDFTSFAAGGRKTYWVSGTRPDDIRLVIVESPIDAMSYHQLNQDFRTRFLSTGGGVGPEHLSLIRAAIFDMPEGSEIISATDRDEAGDKLHEKLVAVAGAIPIRRHQSPVPKDWNDCLRSFARTRAIAPGRPFER